MTQKSSSSGNHPRAGGYRRDPAFEARRAGDASRRNAYGPQERRGGAQKDPGAGSSVGPSRTRPTRADRDDEGLGLGSVVKVIASVVVLMLIVQTFVARLYVIPSASMEPTLRGCPGCTNDRIAVERISYRFTDPAPGDVVVFAGTDSWNVDYNVQLSDNVMARGLQIIAASLGIGPSPENILVKRVIATGGQTVKCEAGDPGVMVNGVAVPSEYTLDPPANPIDTTVGSRACGGEYFGPVEVPAGSLWVMGDNRTNSVDSRAHLGDPLQGTIPVDNVRGKVMAVVLPVSRFGAVDHVDFGV